MGAEGLGLQALGDRAGGLRRGLGREAQGGEEGQEEAARNHTSSYLAAGPVPGLF